MMDFVEQIDNYSPQLGNNKPNSNPYVLEQPINNSSYAPSEPNNVPSEQPSRIDNSEKEAQTGCTRFCKQKYYEEFFKVSEKDVVDRIKATLVPPFNDEFLELVKPSPDFYGPFWIMATMVFLLALVGNFANYVLSKFSNGEQWEGYFFKLELVRYAVVMVYSFGVGVPVVLFFMFKFMKCNSLAFPEIACLYGYSLSCYVPALLGCIIPMGWLQWILMLYAFGNSTFFLGLSLSKHVEGTRVKYFVVLGVLAAAQLLLFLLSKLVFINLGVDINE